MLWNIEKTVKRKPTVDEYVEREPCAFVGTSSAYPFGLFKLPAATLLCSLKREASCDFGERTVWRVSVDGDQSHAVLRAWPTSNLRPTALRGFLGLAGILQAFHRDIWIHDRSLDESVYAKNASLGRQKQSMHSRALKQAIVFRPQFSICPISLSNLIVECDCLRKWIGAGPLGRHPRPMAKEFCVNKLKDHSSGLAGAQADGLLLYQTDWLSEDDMYVGNPMEEFRKQVSCGSAMRTAKALLDEE
nr:retrotransposon-related protein [Ipomoea batatas]